MSYYFYFLCFSAAELVVEAAISLRNSSRLLRKGAVEISPQILPFMIALYVLMHAGSYYEYQTMNPEISLAWVSGFLALFVAAKLLKFWAVSSLGEFWTMRVLIVPDARVVTRGPYRWVRHPNYISVLMEIGAIPLLGKCFWTFLSVFVPFVILLYFRIRAEEAGLMRLTDYKNGMMQRNRFVP